MRGAARDPAEHGEGVQIVRLSHKHEMMLNWLLLNPDRSLRECADHFGVTQSWLSSVIHSDLFQMTLKERQNSVHLKIADSIPEKLRRIGDIALEKLTTCLEDSEDPEYILDATDKVLHRMGFAPASSRNPAGSAASVHNVQNNVFVNADDLAAARQLMQSISAPEMVIENAGSGE